MLQRSKRRNWKIIKVIKTVRLENLAVFLCVDIKRIYFCTIIMCTELDKFDFVLKLKKDETGIAYIEKISK